MTENRQRRCHDLKREARPPVSRVCCFVLAVRAKSALRAELTFQAENTDAKRKKLGQQCDKI